MTSYGSSTEVGAGIDQTGATTITGLQGLMGQTSAYGGAQAQEAAAQGMTPEMYAAMQAQMMQMYQMAAAGGASSVNSIGLPIREGAQSCSYFTSLGECRFGAQCKYNHPEAFVGVQKDITRKDPNLALFGGGPPSGMVNSLGYPVRPGTEACAFFSRTGACRYGATCKWDHPEECTHLASLGGAKHLLPTPDIAGFNSVGLPIRPGGQPCNFYMSTGGCKYGTTCKWDHPEGRGGTEPKQPFPNQIAAQLQTQAAFYGSGVSPYAAQTPVYTSQADAYANQVQQISGTTSGTETGSGYGPATSKTTGEVARAAPY